MMRKYIWIGVFICLGVIGYLGFLLRDMDSPLEVKVDRTDSCTLIVLDKPQPMENLKLMDTLHFLKLEAKENALFGHITKLRVYQNRIFIFDNRYARCLFIYDKKGKHIQTINSFGKGPGEFVMLSDFEIDYRENELLLMDIVQSKLLYFDFDGNFKREVISEAGATHAACIDRQQVVHAKFLDDFWVNRDPKEKIQLLITDKDGKIVSQRSHHQENPELQIHLYDIIKGLPDGTVNYAPLLLDTIYGISGEGEMKAKYAFKYENNISEKYRNKGKDEELRKEIAQGKMCFLGHNIESQDFLYIRLGGAWYNNPIFYSKKSGKTIMLGRERGSLETIFEPLAVEGNDVFWGMILSKDIPDLKYEGVVMDTLGMSPTEDDNPWLFYYRLNEF